MPRDQNRHQRAVERKTAKRKEKKRTLTRTEVLERPASSDSTLRSATEWPLLECLVSRGWNKTSDGPNLTQIVVARQAPNGKIAAGVFLVDLACLGVKNAFAKVFPSRAAYQQELISDIEANQRLDKVDLDITAKIIQEGIAYAKSLGFSPHRDYAQAAPLLAGAKPEASRVKVPLGFKGKPFFVSGPYDNVRKIMAQLTRTVGVGNFDYLAHIDGGTEVFAE